MKLYFDFDGTIADTGPALVEAVRLSFLHQNLPAPRTSALLWRMGQPLLEILGDFLEKPADAPEVLAHRELVERYYAEMAAEEVCLFPGMRELLEKYAQKAQFLVVLTNKPTHCAKREAEKLGIAHFFHEIIGADCAGAPKPEREILETAHVMLDRPFVSEKAFMIGDSTADMGLAKIADMVGIGVTWGAQDAKTLKEAGAVYIADTADALDKILTPYLG